MELTHTQINDLFHLLGRIADSLDNIANGITVHGVNVDRVEVDITSVEL